MARAKPAVRPICRYRRNAPMPTTCSPYAGEMPARDKIVDIYTDGYLQATERQLRFATAGLGLRLSPGATILDFGCGIGSSVRALLAQGYDAYGVGTVILTSTGSSATSPL